MEPWLAVDLGLVPYEPVRELQIALVAARRAGDLVRNAILVLEHEPVFTLGRRGGTGHFRVSPDFLDRSGVPVVHAERGGDVTYHGPGQLVVYCIVDLSAAHLKVVEFVEKLEEVMILTARDCKVEAVRSAKNRGVWVGDCKLGSVGIAVRRGVAFHGLALNVNVDLTPFQWIHPCGLSSVSMTSLSREGAEGIRPARVRPLIRRRTAEVFGVDLQETPPSALEEIPGVPGLRGPDANEQEARNG